MKKFKVKKIKYSNGSVRVLEVTRNINVNGFFLKKGFITFQNTKTREFLGFSSGWVCNGCLAVYVPINKEFELKWIGFDYEVSDGDSDLEKAVFEYGFEFLRNI